MVVESLFGLGRSGGEEIDVEVRLKERKRSRPWQVEGGGGGGEEVHESGAAWLNFWDRANEHGNSSCNHCPGNR